MATEINLADIVEGAVSLEVPANVSALLSEVYITSLNFPKTVLNIRVSTYPLEKTTLKMFFAWEMGEHRSSNVAYIAYDVQKNNYYDWLTAMIREAPRYNHKTLLEYFRERFSKQK